MNYIYYLFIIYYYCAYNEKHSGKILNFVPFKHPVDEEENQPSIQMKRSIYFHWKPCQMISYLSVNLWGLWALSVLLRFYLEYKNRNHFEHGKEWYTDAKTHSQWRQCRMQVTILGMLPTQLSQDEGLSNEKQIFFHSWETALYHSGNNCNHEGGKPVCSQ